MQVYVQEYQYPGELEDDQWKKKHEFRYEDLYKIFTHDQQLKAVTNILPFNSFRDCVSKQLNIKLFRDCVCK